jgi:hypothetical protein
MRSCEDNIKTDLWELGLEEKICFSIGDSGGLL